MIVVITGAAEDDLERIGDYIAPHNPARAVSLVRELRERCEALVDLPRSYPLVPRYEATGIRRRPYGNYLIFYRIAGDRIEVVHVLHGAMNYETILFPDE